MKLYSARLSLFAKKVEIALGEKGIPFDRVLVPFDQIVGYSPKHPDVLAANPKGQVPVLVDGDLTIYDSTVILEYLDEAYPAIPLYPVDPAARARCRMIEMFADEVMLVPLRALMHRTGPRPADSAQWLALEADATMAAVPLMGHFGYLDDLLGGRRNFTGDLSVADIAVFMVVLYIRRLGGPELTEFPALRDWYRAMKNRAVVAQIVAEIVDADRDLSATVDGAYRGDPA